MLGLQNLRISPKLLKLACEVDEFKGAWGAMENHTTSLQLLSDVSSFGRNFKDIAKSWQGKPLNEELLCRLHALFTGAQQMSLYRDGQTVLTIKSDDGIIGELEAAGPEEIRALMPRLMQWVEEAFEKKEEHPLIVIGVFTAIFLQLAPFDRSNQKLARLLVILLMFKSGYSYAPYSTLDSILNARGEEYFKVLKHTQDTLAQGQIDWESWMEFFFSLLVDQKNKLQVRMEKRGGEIVNMPVLSTKILKLFEKHDRLSMKEIERLTRGKRSTLKLRLSELVEGGYLIRHGQARATWYSKV